MGSYEGLKNYLFIIDRENALEGFDAVSSGVDW